MVVGVKYGSQRGGWYSNGVIGLYGVGLWKFIRRGQEKFGVRDDSMISF
jgi:hypothetical protein